MLYLQFENKQEIHLLSSGAEQGLPEGIFGFSLQFLSLIKKCSTSSSTSFFKVPSALSSLANTLQNTQTLVQDMLPRAQGSGLCYTDIRNNRY